jgi:hypothetical protein
MTHNDKISKDTEQALSELSKLLKLSHDASLRLKQDIAGENFPVAFKLERTIRILQDAVDELQHNIDDDCVLDLNYRSLHHDLISSSDQL